MSKQYLTVHTVDKVHIGDIYAVGTAAHSILSAGGGSSILVHDPAQSTFPVRQVIPDGHRVGCHHLVVSHDGRTAASAGYGGEIRVWSFDPATGQWSHKADLPDEVKLGPRDANSMGGADDKDQPDAPFDFPDSLAPHSGRIYQRGIPWALALSADGNLLANTTYDGTVEVWNVGDPAKVAVQATYPPRGRSNAFGLCVDISRDGRFLASGNKGGYVDMYDNETRNRHVFQIGPRPIRAVAFSPGVTRLAAGGGNDNGCISLYDVLNGEFVGSLNGYGAWITSLDWSETGEWLLSSTVDGKVRVWSTERGQCVATHSETDRTVWMARWMRRPAGTGSEMFCAAGADRSITFYREAATA